MNRKPIDIRPPRHLDPRKGSQCDGKTRHETKADARDSAAYLTSKFGEQMHSYRCRFCGGWHVGRPRVEDGE